MRGRRRPGLRGCGGNDVDDRTGPVVCCTYEVCSGNTDTLWIAGKFFAPNYPPRLDDGPYTSTIVSGALTATPEIAAGTGVCPAGSAGCSQVTVDGEPCDESPAEGEASGTAYVRRILRGCILQNAKVGDVFTIDAEFVVLVAKNGNQWTLQRGYGLSSPSAHSSTTLDGTLHGARLLPRRLELVVDVGHGERSSRDQ